MTESLKKTGLLCLPFDGVLYGVELPYVIESVRNVRIASLPFLPEYYCGVCNRMGSITPVVSLARLCGGEEKPEHGVTVMLRCGAYDCGVLTQREPPDFGGGRRHASERAGRGRLLPPLAHQGALRLRGTENLAGRRTKEPGKHGRLPE